MIKTNRSVAQLVQLPVERKVPHKLCIILQNTKCPTNCTSARRTQSAPQVVHQSAEHEVPHKLYIGLQNMKYRTSCTSACSTRNAAHLYISLQNTERRTTYTTACRTQSVPQIVRQPAEQRAPHKLYIGLQHT